MNDSVLLDVTSNAVKIEENMGSASKEDSLTTSNPVCSGNESSSFSTTAAAPPPPSLQPPPPPAAAASSLIQGLSRPGGDSIDDAKRPREDEEEEDNTAVKKQRSDGDACDSDSKDADGSNIPPVLPSKEGLAFFNDNDVLSGRGGGTNVHPGNRNFRDLINLHRRAYLKARKNDKPAISRAIVRSIRESNGRFLKRDEKSGLWYEIGDDAAREKTSQALRQRAPEMRKLLFESEREEARVVAEEHLRQQQRMLMGMPGEYPNMPPGMPPMMPPGMNPMMNPALFQMANKNAYQPGMVPPNLQQDPYAQMSQNLMTAALLGGGINRFAPNGA